MLAPEIFSTKTITCLGQRISIKTSFAISGLGGECITTIDMICIQLRNQGGYVRSFWRFFPPKLAFPNRSWKSAWEMTQPNQVGTIISSILSELELPSWEPTYPSRKALLDFWVEDVPNIPGGICDRSLEGKPPVASTLGWRNYLNPIGRTTTRGRVLESAGLKVVVNLCCFSLYQRGWLMMFSLLLLTCT